MVRLPGLVGRAYAQTARRTTFPPQFIEALKTDGGAHWDFAHGAILTYFQVRGEAWADRLLDQAIKEKWGDLALNASYFPCLSQSILWSVPLKLAAKSKQPTGQNSKSSKSTCPRLQDRTIVERLLHCETRPRETVHYAGQYVADIPSDLLIRVLTEAVSGQANRGRE